MRTKGISASSGNAEHGRLGLLAYLLKELPSANIAICEPTAHRFVRRVILPPPHHPHECRPEPTRATPAGVGSSRHGPSGASPGGGDRGRWWSRTAHVSPPIPAVSCIATSSASRTQPAE